MIKTVEKWWKSLSKSVWENGEKVSTVGVESIDYMESCGKNNRFTHNGVSYAPRFTQGDYPWYNSLVSTVSTVSTGSIITMINKISIKDYNI